MNTHLPFLIVLAAFTAGCSKPSSPPAASPPPTSNVRWFTNAQGFIVSDVKTNDFFSSTSTNGTLSIRFDGSKQVRDPLEDAPEFAAAFRDANAQADAATQRWKGQLGRIHSFWEKKKEVLRDNYRIDWKSPADLNPMTSYD
jgi:hypothetical protein